MFGVGHHNDKPKLKINNGVGIISFYQHHQNSIMKNSNKFIIGVIIIFMLFFGVMVSKLNNSNTNTILNEEGNGKIKLIREAMEGRQVNYKILELENGDTFKISNSLVETVHVGDSVYKNKGETFYNIVNSKTKEIRKISM